jgi:3-dehydrosphinganine reductase
MVKVGFVCFVIVILILIFSKNMSQIIKEKHAIITGGSSGIGKATAQQLVREGFNLSLIARDPIKLNEAKLEIERIKIKTQQRIITFSADVTNQIQIQEAIVAAIAENGCPNLLITSAGMVYPDYFQRLSLAIFEETMAVNYFGTLYCIKAVLPQMIANKKGHLVIISSGAGLIGIYGYTAYSSSKFALRGLAESLRGELKSLGIKVSIVYPPDTDTPQLALENQTKPPETKLITRSAKTFSSEAVAREIIRGIKRQSFMITPGLEMTILGKFHSLIAPGLNWYFDRLVQQVKSDKCS